MAYQPFAFTTTSTAQKAAQYDAKRTSLTITNLSGETCFWGVDSTLTTGNGVPIFNNGRVVFNYQSGSDPRKAVWLIGTLGGTVSIGEEISEEYNDPESVIGHLGGIHDTLRNMCRKLGGG